MTTLPLFVPHAAAYFLQHLSPDGPVRNHFNGPFPSAFAIAESAISRRS